MLNVGSDFSAGTKSWWVHLVHSGIEQICRPRADDLLHGSHGAAEGGQPTCSGSTWYTPGGLISQAAYACACAWRTRGMCMACVVCAWRVRLYARWRARQPHKWRRGRCPITHTPTQTLTHTHTPQVVTLTLLDIVFLVLNELLWGLCWTVVSRLLGRRSYAQSSINAYYEPPAFLFADRYAYMLKIAAMVMVFAPAVPLPAPMHQCTIAPMHHAPMHQCTKMHQCTHAGPMLQPYAPNLQPCCVSRCRCSTGWAA